MNLIRYPNQKTLAPSVATMGCFDGMHRGHQSLIQAVLDHSKTSSLIPHVILVYLPTSFSGKKSNLSKLMTYKERLRYLKAQGIEQVTLLKITPELQKMAAPQFTTEVLLQHLQVKHLIVGYDFKFAAQRSGDITTLKNTPGIHSTALPPIIDTDTTISSTVIRQMLTAKSPDMPTINRYLGHDFSIAGYVKSGYHLGKKIGYPTANLHFKSPVITHGVYLVYSILNGSKVYGVAHIGPRPISKDKTTILEVHYLHEHQSLYGTYLAAHFLNFIRPTIAIDDPQQLQQQIAADITSAQALLKLHR